MSACNSVYFYRERNVSCLFVMIAVWYDICETEGDIDMKKRIRFLFVIICLASFLSGFSLSYAESDPWAVSYTTYNVTYDAVVKQYLKLINGYQTKNYGRHDLFNDMMFWDAPDETTIKEKIAYVKRDIGFYSADINQDGIDELVINGTGGRIYEVFTMDDGKVRELIRGGGRYDCHLLNDGTFYRFGSSGAAYHDYEIWQMNGTGKVSYAEGYSMRPDNVNLKDIWFHTKRPSRQYDAEKGEPVSASVAESWIAQQENRIVRHRFVPFIAYEKFPDDPWNLGVLAKDNKTSTSAKIRIRKEPDDHAKVSVTKKVGTYVKVLAKENGYYKIMIGNKEGYVKEEYLIPVTWQENDTP